MPRNLPWLMNAATTTIKREPKASSSDTPRRTVKRESRAKEEEAEEEDNDVTPKAEAAMTPGSRMKKRDFMRSCMYLTSDSLCKLSILRSLTPCYSSYAAVLSHPSLPV